MIQPFGVFLQNRLMSRHDTLNEAKAAAKFATEETGLHHSAAHYTFSLTDLLSTNPSYISDYAHELNSYNRMRQEQNGLTLPKEEKLTDEELKNLVDKSRQFRKAFYEFYYSIPERFREDVHS